MGQGVFTSLPMIIAEEAELDWGRVSVKQGVHCGVTGGSSSVRHTYEPYRQIGATIRQAMIAAAAQEWGLPEDECAAQRSEVVHRGSAKAMPYSNLLRIVRSRPLPEPKMVTLKNPKKFALIGKPRDHLDIPAKVQGKARFGLHVRLPGMVYAVVAQRPTLDGSLVRFDASVAKSIPDVIDIFEIATPKTVEENAISLGRRDRLKLLTGQA